MKRTKIALLPTDYCVDVFYTKKYSELLKTLSKVYGHSSEFWAENIKQCNCVLDYHKDGEEQIILVLNTFDISYLIHEAIHVYWELDEKVGFHTCYKSQEVQAYYVDYIVGELLKFKDRKKMKPFISYFIFYCFVVTAGTILLPFFLADQEINDKVVPADNEYIWDASPTNDVENMRLGHHSTACKHKNIFTDDIGITVHGNKFFPSFYGFSLAKDSVSVDWGEKDEGYLQIFVDPNYSNYNFFALELGLRSDGVVVWRKR